MSHVDTPSPITHVSLCAGYGGIDIGLSRAVGNLRTIAFSEIEAFACANLVSKMEAGLLDCAPIWTNLKTFPWSEFRGVVDILSGGYPCQPFSAAGKRLGTEDPRHLWPYIADGIAAMRPSVCFFENVEGHISLGLPDVIEDLGRLGYRTTWGIFSASEVGAPHQRKRVFIMAHDLNRGCLQGRFLGGVEGIRAGQENHASPVEKSDSQLAHLVGTGLQGFSGDGYGDSQREGSLNKSASKDGIFNGGVWPSRPGQPQHEWEPPRVVGNAKGREDNGREPGDMGEASSQGGCGNDAAGYSSEGCLQRQAEPSLGGDTNGATRWLGHAELYVSCDNRTDELRLLGNGVVPATAELAFRTLWEELTNEQ